MPHVVIKMFPGRTEEQKQRLAGEITKSVTSITGCEEKVVSVAIEEISPDKWADTVYKNEIMGKEDSLYKKPGYNPFKK